MQKKLLFFLLIIMVIWKATELAAKENVINSHSVNNAMKLLHQQNLLEKEGKGLERNYEYGLAKEKYLQAIELGKQRTPRRDYWRPQAYYARVLQKEGKYKKAMEMLTSLVKEQPENQYFSDRLAELEVLIGCDRNNDKLLIYNFIKSLKQKHVNIIPPNGYDGIFGVTAIETIFRLYDTIGDYDAGIAYIDLCMEFFKRQDMKKYGEYKPGKVDAEYLKVREGFEKDKEEGRQGCLNAKEGEVCMGRATQALIQSDYFPW